MKPWILSLFQKGLPPLGEQDFKQVFTVVVEAIHLDAHQSYDQFTHALRDHPEYLPFEKPLGFILGILWAELNGQFKLNEWEYFTLDQDPATGIFVICKT